MGSAFYDELNERILSIELGEYDYGQCDEWIDEINKYEYSSEYDADTSDIVYDDEVYDCLDL